MKITVDNVKEIMRSISVSDDLTILKDQARAWKVIYDLCYQQGMSLDESDISGLQRVVKFITKKTVN